MDFGRDTNKFSITILSINQHNSNIKKWGNFTEISLKKWSRVECEFERKEERKMSNRNWMKKKIWNSAGLIYRREFEMKSTPARIFLYNNIDRSDYTTLSIHQIKSRSCFITLSQPLVSMRIAQFLNTFKNLFFLKHRWGWESEEGSLCMIQQIFSNFFLCQLST